MGTAIDPELEDELRVTVVATGLGQQITAGNKETMKIVKRNTAGDVDYGDYDKPTIQRKKASGDGLTGTLDDDLLDNPAFLRRQAD